MYLMVLNRTLKMVKEVNFILCVFYHNKKMGKRASLVVWWLRLCASSARGAGSIPGWGTKIPHAMHCGQKIKNKK